jgi:hypothetical protein
MAIPNLPNWTYQIKQLAAGFYLLQGVDKRGHLLNSIGMDLDILEDDFFDAAQKIDQSSD